MHKEGRIVSKQRIRKDNRECVRRQRVKKKHLLNVMKEVMRSVTMEEGFTGAGEEKQKGVIYYISKTETYKNHGYLLNKTFQGQRGQGASSEVGMREGREEKAVIQMKSKKCQMWKKSCSACASLAGRGSVPE